VLKDARVKDKAALYILYQAVDESGFEKIASAKSSKEAWDILEKAYKGDDRVKQVRLQTLRGDLESMRMEETEGVAEYITRVETVANQLSRNGETLPASRVVEKILRSLTNNFENVVCAIEESKDLSMLTVEELAGSLEAYEQRKKKKKWEPLDQLLQTKMSIKDDKAQNTQGRGRYREGIRSGPGGRSRGQEEKQALQKRHLEFEEDASSLQELLQIKKDLRTALEVQDEKWRLEMDEEIEEIEHNNTRVWYDLSKGSQPIDKNSVNDKSATKTKNPMSNKSVKEKNKFASKDAKTERADNKLAIRKAKYKSTIDKVEGKSIMKKAKNLTIHERDKHNVRRVIASWKP